VGMIVYIFLSEVSVVRQSAVGEFLGNKPDLKNSPYMD
jgi:hypothetical protein